MNQKTSIVAQKLVNLYRQEHVIIGGWAALNPIFLQEATPDVLREMSNIPTGNNLVKHIQNLRSGKTDMNSIDRDLLPYGGMMDESKGITALTDEQFAELEDALKKFTPDEQGLFFIKNTSVVKHFGNEWLVGVKKSLLNRPDLLAKWDIVVKTYRAYSLWNSAISVIQQPVSDRIRATIQADMPEYETYLPMFGNAGQDLLNKLRTFISSINHNDSELE
ncbi:MAG: hypothetical protein ACLRFI_02530 [Alphaproteobacteria bacterium]